MWGVGPCAFGAGWQLPNDKNIVRRAGDLLRIPGMLSEVFNQLLSTTLSKSTDASRAYTRISLSSDWLLLQTNSVRAVTEAVMLTGTGPASCTVEGWGDETCPEQFCSSKCFSFLSERTCAGYSIDQQTPVLTGRCQEGIHYTSVFIDKPWIPCDYEVIKGI